MLTSLIVSTLLTIQGPSLSIPSLAVDPAYEKQRDQTNPGKWHSSRYLNSLQNIVLTFAWEKLPELEEKRNFDAPAAPLKGVSEVSPDGFPIGSRFRLVSNPGMFTIESFLPDGIASLKVSRAPTTERPNPAQDKTDFGKDSAKWVRFFRQYSAQIAARRASSTSTFTAKVTDVEFKKIAEFESLDAAWPNTSKVRLRKNGNELIFVLGANGYKKDGVWKTLSDGPIVRGTELFVPSSSLE